MNDQQFQVSQSTASLANAVTGFSIAQNLIVMTSIYEGKAFKCMINDDFNIWLGATLLFGAAYLSVLTFLYLREIKLLSESSNKLKIHAKLMYRARSAAIIFVFILVISTGVKAHHKETSTSIAMRESTKTQ